MPEQIGEEVGVTLSEIGVGVCLARAGASGVWVVDANSTALVTPRFITVASGCSCRSRQPQILHQPQQQPRKEEQLPTLESRQPSVAAVTHPTSCQPSPCLNSGRCIAEPRGPRSVECFTPFQEIHVFSCQEQKLRLIDYFKRLTHSGFIIHFIMVNGFPYIQRAPH